MEITRKKIAQTVLIGYLKELFENWLALFFIFEYILLKCATMKYHLILRFTITKIRNVRLFNKQMKNRQKDVLKMLIFLISFKLIKL